MIGSELPRARRVRSVGRFQRLEINCGKGRLAASAARSGDGDELALFDGKIDSARVPCDLAFIELAGDRFGLNQGSLVDVLPLANLVTF